jgi:hypothetical protein
MAEIDEEELRSLLENPDEGRIRALLVLEKQQRGARRSAAGQRYTALKGPGAAIFDIARASGKKVWERQEEEAPLWYERFCVYRTMGPKRSIAKTFEVVKQRDGLGGKEPGSSWMQAAANWMWERRAQAWDMALLEESEAREAQHRWESHQRRRFLADQALGMVFQAIKNAHLEKMGQKAAREHLGELIKLFQQAMVLDRAESGVHTYLLDKSGALVAEDKTVTVDKVVAALRELEAWSRDAGVLGPDEVEGQVV